MKLHAKHLYIALATGLCLTFGFQALKVEADDFKVGVVDTQEILTKSKLFAVLKNAEQDIANAEKKLVTIRNQKIKELEAAQKTLTPEEYIKLKNKYELEIAAQYKAEEGKLKESKGRIEKMKTDLENNVQKAVEDIAKSRGLSIVVNKQLVLFGGSDITKDVVGKVSKQLN